MKDDNFENVEKVVQKDREIAELRRTILEKETLIKELGTKSIHPSINKPVSLILPKQYQKIKFKLAGNESISLEGKVMRKQKKNSVNRNIVGILFHDGSEKDFDFAVDIIDWSYINESSEDLEDTCCLHSFSEEKDLFHEIFATKVLTKAQVKGRADAEDSWPRRFRSLLVLRLLSQWRIMASMPLKLDGSLQSMMMNQRDID